MKKFSVMKQIADLFLKYTGERPESIEELPSSGSNRRYFRVKSGETSLIGAAGTSVDENIAFIEIDKDFKRKGLNVPEVYAVSEDKRFYLQQDLGDLTLFNAVAKGREAGSYSAEEVELLKSAIKELPHLQFVGGEGLDYSICFPQPSFDERMVSFDLNYFKYCFLKATGLEFSEIKLHDDFQKLSANLLEESRSETFLYRDFQARNVMIYNGAPYFIDFQGGRKGPIYYDLASFVWQAKANYSEELKRVLIETYREELKNYISIEDGLFYDKLRHFVLFRTMQVLGAYGFRGYFEKKPHFLQSVPFAIDNLRKLIKSKPFYEYPYLQELLTGRASLRTHREMEEAMYLIAGQLRTQANMTTTSTLLARIRRLWIFLRQMAECLSFWIMYMPLRMLTCSATYSASLQILCSPSVAREGSTDLSIARSTWRSTLRKSLMLR